jgi:diadenosine tetraphosphatase ApaH/serine/threonine PP2A family protein phosphatase
MRVALVSDVHSNLHALDAVLEAIDGESPDELWCLGDIVGYGPRPDECCGIVEERASICLAGNHDLGVRGDVDIDDFAPDAAAAALWTRGVLGDRAKAFLDGLEPTAETEGAQLFHASPRDPVWEYILTDQAAAAALEETKAPIVLVGHSHIPLAVTIDAGGLGGGHAPAGTEIALGGNRWLLNPGSVGQPRDGDPRAAWLLLDTGAQQATWRRTEYDIAGAQAAIRAAGLPDVLAERLERGQ